MQLLLQNFICPLRDSHTASTSWSLKKRIDFLLLIAVNYIHTLWHSIFGSCNYAISSLLYQSRRQFSFEFYAVGSQ